jgi:hypothetical protein
MRVNMDSSILSDTRFKRLGKALGIPYQQAVGACFFVWLTCYEHRSEALEAVDIDLAADIEGFAEAMVKCKIAHRDGDTIIVHGVTERIKFLNKQKVKGSSGGNAKAQKTRVNKANVADATRTPVADATGAALAYSPALALTPALAPPPPLPPEEVVGGGGEVIRIENFTSFIDAWNATQLPGSGKIRREATRVGLWQMRLADEYWRENWREAIARAGRSSRCCGLGKDWSGLMVDTFLKDSTMLTRILEGQFDDVTTVNAPRVSEAERLIAEAMRGASS